MVAAAEVYTSPVRYYEVDMQGVVFNMWYLCYVDEASAWFLGRLPGPTLQDLDLDFQVVHAEVDWAGSLRAGDIAHIAVDVEKIGTTSFTLRYDIRGLADLESDVLVTVRTVYVTVARDLSGKRPIPDSLREALVAAS